jgi:hypothetical protein
MRQHADRLGYYLVGFKKFHNKMTALIESKKTGYQPKWVFNDDIYGRYDWSLPIQESLQSLYLRRAKQLREQYDYLVLYFSGGADSGNILNTFLSNNIFLDEIVMQIPEPMKTTFSKTDLSMRNNFAEIEYSALPMLKKYDIPSGTKITLQDFSKPVLEMLSKDDWFENNPIGTNFCLSSIGRQYAVKQQSSFLDLADTGKTVVQIIGIDKPLVYFDGTDYFCYFSDSSAGHFSAPIDFNNEWGISYHTEFFYWTADIPEIVIKQAQEIKAIGQANPAARTLFSESLRKHIQYYKAVLHPIIYPNIQIDFETEKPNSSMVRPLEEWFWASASEEVKSNYVDVVKYLGQHIDVRHCIDQDVFNGMSACNSKFYKL